MRLITIVDDHGRFEADPTLLASLCFPMNREVDARRISDICQHLSASDMVLFYEVAGTQYLQLTRWTERIRSKSRYPDPPTEVGGHLTTFDNKCSPPKPVAISHKPSPSPSALVETTTPQAAEKDSGNPCPEPEDADSESSRRFKPPTVEQCVEYFNDNGGNEHEGKKFFHFYESKDWKVGKVKMKKWKAAAVGWIYRAFGQASDNQIAPVDVDEIRRLRQEGFDREAALLREKMANMGERGDAELEPEEQPL